MGMADNSEMMPARLAWIAIFAVACASQPSTDAAVTLDGVVENIDTIHQTITLSSLTHESRSESDVHYDAMTIVDTVRGTVHVDQLQYGSTVVIHGRRDLKTNEVTADRIVVTK
jgi:hypothetical protein